MRISIIFCFFLTLFNANGQTSKLKDLSLQTGELESISVMPKMSPKHQRKHEVKGRFVEVFVSPKEVAQLYIRKSKVKTTYFNSDKKRFKVVLNKMIWKNVRFRLMDDVELNERVFLISQAIDHMQKRHYIVAFEFDKSGLKLETKNPIVLVDEEDDENSMFQDDLVNNGNLQDKLVIYSRKYIRNKGSVDRIIVCGDDLKVLLNEKIRFPESDMVKRIDNVYFQNEISIAITAYCSSESRLYWPKNNVPNYSMKIYHFTNNLQNVIGYSMGKEGYYPTSFIPVINDRNELIVAGFYSRSNFLYMHGLFLLKVNLNSKEIINNTFQEINKETAAALMTVSANRIAASKARRTGEFTMHEFNLRQLYFSATGEIKLIAEDVRSESTARMVYPFFVPTTNYHFGDLIVFELNNKGSINWATRIKKKSKSKRIYREQFVSFLGNQNQCNFIFNYNLRNLKKNKDAIRSRSKKSAPVLVRLDDNGKQSLEILKVPTSSKSVVFYPESFREDENNDGSDLIFKLKLRDRKKIGYYSFKYKQ